MTSFDIKFKKIEDVQNFIKIVTACPCSVDLCSGRYIVDAKSIMGIYSLDLSEKINVVVHSGDAEDLKAALKDYIV